MFDRKEEKFKPIEVSAGLLVGYVIGGLINMVINEKSWTEAFSDDKLIMGLAAISLSVFLYLRQKRKEV